MIREAEYAEVRTVQQGVLRPHGPLPADAQPDATWRYLAYEVAGEVVGACTVSPSPWQHPDLCELPEPQWQLRSMAMLADYRGGTGSELLAAAVDLARREGAASLWANARVEALNLYLRQGWKPVGPEWMKPGVGPHRWIVLTHLRSPAHDPTGVE